MVNLTPSQLAVLHGGVKYIKNHVKLKKPRKKSSRNRRKRSRGTRKAQKGGSVKKIIEILFLSALFGSFLITMGVDAPLDAMIKLISSQVGENVQAQSITNFVEYLTILLAYNHIDWNEAGGMPPSCEAGTTTYGVKGYFSWTTETVPGWAQECPEKARIMGLYIVSLLAGMLLAFVGPVLLRFMARGIPSSMSLPTSPQEDPFAKALAALDKAETQVISKKKGLSSKQKQAMENRRKNRKPPEFKRQGTTPDIRGPPVRGDPRIRPSEGVDVNPDIRDSLLNAPIAKPRESGDALVVTNQPEGVTFTMSQDLIDALKRQGNLSKIADMFNDAANDVQGNVVFQDLVGTLGSGILTNGDGEILPPPVSPTCARSPQVSIEDAQASIEDAPSSLSAIPPSMPPPGDSSGDEVGAQIYPRGGKKKHTRKNKKKHYKKRKHSRKK